MNEDLLADAADPVADGSLSGSLADALALGGPVVWTLIALSVIALTVAVFKTVEMLLARRGATAVKRALGAWGEGRRDRALDALGDARRGIPRLVLIAMRGREDGAPETLVREELQRVAANDMQRLRGNLRTLEVIGQIAPLLGLFGTVLGMIEAFRAMEAAGSQVDPAVLSGGIWQALLTTGVGLAVAIPVVLAHQWLERRADSHAHRIEDAVTRVFTADLYGTGERAAAHSTEPGRGGRHPDERHAA